MLEPLERVRAAEVRRMTSLSLRQIQDMAAKGDIPGAAKLGGVWTFDPVRIQLWIREQQRICLANRKTSTSEARHGGDVSALPDESIEVAYEQLIRAKRPGGSRGGARNSNERR